MNLIDKAKGAAEMLKTEAIVAGQVIKGRALAETLIPSKRNRIDVTVYDKDGNVKSTHVGFNSRIDAGASWQASLMGSAAGTPANYMALAAAAITITKTDTFIGSNASNANEIAANGLSRALGTYAYTGAPGSVGGATSYTISKTFSATGTQTVAAVALFNASSVGTLFVEANLTTSASLASGDSLAVTYTINI